MTAFVDTNVIVRHLTGDPPEMAGRATALLVSDDQLLLTDLVVAECIYVLESYYEVSRETVAGLMRSAITASSMSTVDPALLLRAITVYDEARIDFAEAYLVAQAEASGVGEIVSFDRALDRVATVTRREP